MKTFIKIVLLSFLFIISFSSLSQAQSGKGAYGNAISRRQSGSRSADYITRGLRFNADVCAGGNLELGGEVNVTAGAGYQFSPYVYLGGVIGYGHAYLSHRVIIATDVRVYFMKKRVTPMLSAQLGYMRIRSSWDTGEWETYGFVHASCGIGARIYLTKKLGFTARFMTSITDGAPFLGFCAGIEF